MSQCAEEWKCIPKIIQMIEDLHEIWPVYWMEDYWTISIQFEKLDKYHNIKNILMRFFTFIWKEIIIVRWALVSNSISNFYLDDWRNPKILQYWFNYYIQISAYIYLLLSGCQLLVWNVNSKWNEMAIVFWKSRF
jgi:hypothetical protein